ncbi:MAG: glycoside hydrolase family 130 protein [Planctomycetota bacterium]|nr:glycoside hydrolase family 130 protein [Planctomycetota bacterium]
MEAFRSPENPIIEPKDVRPSRDDFEVIGVLNAGVARFEDEVILLVRVAERPINKNSEVVLTAVYDVAEDRLAIKEFPKSDPETDFSDPRLIVRPAETYLTSISHLRVARSKDGINFEIDDAPTISASNEYETFGVEDPRISLIDGTYYIHYVAVSPLGVATYLMSTKDFASFKRHGVIFCPENKDVAIFPEKIAGKFYALHRPVSPLFKNQDIWLADSPDLLAWGNHRHLLGPRPGCWDEAKIGASAVPFRIEQGWLEVYHGVDRNNRYCLGAILLDGDEPWRIVARSEYPIFEPQASYECEGFFGNVVFSCGVLHEEKTLKIYYGAADTTICYAELSQQGIFDNLNL